METGNSNLLTNPSNLDLLKPILLSFVCAIITFTFIELPQNTHTQTTAHCKS